MNKGIVIGIVIVLAVGIVGLGYWLAKPATAPTPQNPTSGTLPDTAGSRPTQTTKGELKPQISAVFNDEIEHYVITKENVVVGITPKGKIVRAQGTAKEEVSNNAPAGFLRGKISEDGSKAFALVGNKETSSLFLFANTSKTWSLLVSSNVIDAAWSPATSTLAYLTRNNGVISLFTLNTGNLKNKAQQIISLHAEDFRLVWSGSDTIILTTPPSGLVGTFAFEVNLKNKALAFVLENVNGGELVWNSTNEEGLLFKAGDAGRGGILQILESQKNPSRTLSFITLPEKCGFEEGGALFCAVPEDQRMLALNTLPDAYYKREFLTTDTLYRIDLQGGNLEAWPAGDNPIDATLLTPIDNRLYFINRYNNKLWVIEK